MKMQNLTRPILLLIACMLLASCVTREKCTKYFPPQIIRTDSVTVTVREQLHDTTFILADDSSMLQALLECDSAGQAVMKELTGYREGARTDLPRVNIRGNVLTAECRCDSAVIHAILKSRETVTEKKSQEKESPPPVEVKYIPGWMWFFGITGMICWTAFLLWIIYRIVIAKIIRTRT